MRFKKPIKIPVYIYTDQELEAQKMGVGNNDDMGFSDLRAAAFESRPSVLWGVFHQLAILNGEMTFQDSVKSFSDTEKVKKWVSQIRKKLQHVFPNIPGDPFHPYKQAKGYKTRFSLINYPTSM